MPLVEQYPNWVSLDPVTDTQSLADVFSHVGITIHPFTLQIILPIGISFYTFHGLSYVIDIYKNLVNVFL